MIAVWVGAGTGVAVGAGVAPCGPGVAVYAAFPPGCTGFFSQFACSCSVIRVTNFFMM